MHTKTLAQLSKSLSAREFSSRELTQHYLNRIKKYDKKLNSFITVCEDSALQAADAADARRAKGDNHPLLGIPLAQKDIFCTKGVKTSCGSKMLDNFIAPYDAFIIEQFNKAGMVMLGKTNMDEFAMGSSNETSFYGAVCNPWDTERVPGGSSGGSAAAVAARLTPMATGTDTGGSIRQPAALCGITGLKPTYGRVSRFGMIAFASSLDQAGPMTQTAEDAAMIMNVMARFDARDSTCVNHPVPDYTADLNRPLKGLRVGLPKEFINGQLDRSIAACMENSIEALEKLGATFKEISLPHTRYSVPVYYIVAPAECSSNLSRFDGVRFGHRCKDPRSIEDLYKRSRSEGFGEEVKRRIVLGTYALSSGYFDAYYVKAQKVRRLISNDYAQAFTEVDVILSPTSPCTAFKIGERMADPVSMYLSDIYTIATNLAGLPGISIPTGFVDNLPVGVQLTANYFEESRLLNVAHQLQCEMPWQQKIPNVFE